MMGSKGEYGIVVKHLKTKEVFSVNEHEVFEAGSLYKLWVMAEAFSQIEQGRLKKDDVLSQDIAVLNTKFSIASDEAELKEGRIEMIVSQALTQMISISHNYAALLLSDRLKNSEISAFLEKQGFNKSSLGGLNGAPTSTPLDIALFYEKLYNGEIVDRDASREMLEILKQQKLNDGILRYLSKDVAVAHKTGDIGWFKHDTGIVFGKKGDYIIVVLSRSDFPLGAQEQIAKLSKAVYQYFDQ